MLLDITAATGVKIIQLCLREDPGGSKCPLLLLPTGIHKIFVCFIDDILSTVQNRKQEYKTL